MNAATAGDQRDQRITALLDGLDTVLNSNTLLLCASITPTSSVDDLCQQLTAWIHTGDFQEQMLAQDQQRNWHNYHRWIDANCLPEPRTGSFVPVGAHIRGTAITNDTAIAHLIDLLTDQRSPYGHQLPTSDAETIARCSWTLLTQANASIALRLIPDFLHIRPLDDDDDDVPSETTKLYYFDGFNFDGALAIATGTTAWMLLHNGMP